MTTHELEQFIERIWNNPQQPPAHIPVEVTEYALERARRVRSCELKRVLAAIGNWLRGKSASSRRGGHAGQGNPAVASPC